MKQSAVTLLCVFALSSCGPVSSSNTSAATADVSGAAPPQGETGGPRVMEPLTPPGAGNRPLAPGESGTQYTPDGLPVLQPLGVNVDTMFSERIKDEDKRFERLENAVKDMRREFDAVKPSILRLVAVEQDMQDLIAQLETLLRTEPPPASSSDAAVVEEPVALVAPPIDGNAPAMASESPQPPAPAAQAPPPPPVPPAQAPPPSVPAPAQAEEKPEPLFPVTGETAEKPPPEPVAPIPAIAPPESASASGGKAVSAPTGAITVQELRIGEHGDKTRLVFDITGPASYRYDIDNGEKIMIVELPGAGWAGSSQWTSAKAPLLASYTVSPSDGGGSRVIIQLKQAVSVVYETTLAAGAGAPYRIVLDLKGQ